MAKAKKLKSGSWRCLVYSHTDTNGKRKYESFTSDDPSASGKREAEFAAAEFALRKKKCTRVENLTLREAIDRYISSHDAVLSPTTLLGYKTIKNNAFEDILDLPIKKLSTDILQRAVNTEAKRITRKKKIISPKTVHNEYGLITAVLNLYHRQLDFTVRLPVVVTKEKELLPPEIIMNVVRGEEIELPVLLAMWLSFTMSEVRGLKWNSIKDGYISVNQVVVDVEGGALEKEQAKTKTRRRKHKLPAYIISLLDAIPKKERTSEYIISCPGSTIYSRFVRLLKKNDLPHMTFHDLRHINASVMALLRIPDKYAMERGGWKTDAIMKKVYTHTFTDEREAVDELIDNYFNHKMQHEMQHK